MENSDITEFLKSAIRITTRDKPANNRETTTAMLDVPSSRFYIKKIKNNYFLPKVRLSRNLIHTLGESNMLARRYLFNLYRNKDQKPIECTMLSKFESKITYYGNRSQKSGSQRSSEIICSDSDSDEDADLNSKSLDIYSGDSVGNSDIMSSKSTSMNFSEESKPVDDLASETFGHFKDDLESEGSSELEKMKENSGNFPWNMSDNMSESKQSETSKHSMIPILIPGEIEPISVVQERSPKTPTLRVPLVKNIHATISSSIFSQNHLNNGSNDPKKNNDTKFLSRQVSAMEYCDEQALKKSKTLTDKVASTQPQINVYKPNFDFENVDLMDMIKSRDIMDSKMLSHRSNLNSMLKNKNNSKQLMNKLRGVNSEGLQSIKELSINSKRDKFSSIKKKSTSQTIKSRKVGETPTVNSNSMSHFEFLDHNTHQDDLDSYSKDDIIKLNNTDTISEISGLQGLISTKLSEHKEFLSGVGSLTNLTQYIDFPYMNISKHASRISRDFQTQDNLSLFGEGVLQRNFEEITKKNGRLSIDNFFSNIKKNPTFDRVTDSKLESIQGPYFTGKQSQKKNLEGTIQDKPERTLQRNPVHHSNPNLLSFAMELSKSKKFIQLGHKKVGSMRLQTLPEDGPMTELNQISKTDFVFNLKYFQNCLINASAQNDPDNSNHFLSSRGAFKHSETLQSKQDFSKQKKLRKSLHRARSQQFENVERKSLEKLLDSHKKEQSKKKEGKFVLEGMDIKNFFSIIKNDKVKTISTKNMLDAKELEKINEIMRVHSEGQKTLSSKSKRNPVITRQPKPSIDKNLNLNFPLPLPHIAPIPAPIQHELIKEKKEKFNYLKESFKLISSDHIREDIQRVTDLAEKTSIKKSKSRLDLDFSDIEEIEDDLVNPLDSILNDQLSVRSEEVKANSIEDLGREFGCKEGSIGKLIDSGSGSGSKSKSKSGEGNSEDSLSEDDELDFGNPDFKFVDYLETKTKKLFTKREIRANISWSSSEYDIYNPKFTDDESSTHTAKSTSSDKFYLESENEDDRSAQSKKKVFKPKAKRKLKPKGTKTKKSGARKGKKQKKKLKQEAAAVRPQFNVVISNNESSEEWQSNSHNHDSIIKINDCSEGIQISISSSSSQELSKRSYVRIGSQNSEEEPTYPPNFNLAKTQDFRELLQQNDNGHTRKNKHFISLKKIREKGKVGIEKKWGQFLTRKVEERMRRDSDISTKDQGFGRPPYTNRSKKSKNPLNVSLNICNPQKFNQIQKINFSFHSRYKDEMQSGTSTHKDNKYNRSKNTSLVRGSRSQKKKYRSRKSSHCLKTGLFGVINNTDNIYSVQNRRITMDSTDSIKNKSFFPSDNFTGLGSVQTENINNIHLKINSTMGRATSKYGSRLTQDNLSLFSSTHQERQKPFNFGFQIKKKYRTKFKKANSKWEKNLITHLKEMKAKGKAKGKHAKNVRPSISSPKTRRLGNEETISKNVHYKERNSQLYNLTSKSNKLSMNKNNLLPNKSNLETAKSHEDQMGTKLKRKNTPKFFKIQKKNSKTFEVNNSQGNNTGGDPPSRKGSNISSFIPQLCEDFLLSQENISSNHIKDSRKLLTPFTTKQGLQHQEIGDLSGSNLSIFNKADLQIKSVNLDMSSHDEINGPKKYSYCEMKSSPTIKEIKANIIMNSIEQYNPNSIKDLQEEFEEKLANAKVPDKDQKIRQSKNIKIFREYGSEIIGVGPKLDTKLKYKSKIMKTQEKVKEKVSKKSKKESEDLISSMFENSFGLNSKKIEIKIAKQINQSK